MGEVKRPLRKRNIGGVQPRITWCAEEHRIYGGRVKRTEVRYLKPREEPA